MEVCGEERLHGMCGARDGRAGECAGVLVEKLSVEATSELLRTKARDHP